MASNEHKNLDNDNLHVPLDFAGAGTNTVLTKNASSEVDWIPENNLKSSYVKIQGYGTGLTGGSTGFYIYRDDITDNDSPFNFNQDYGNAVGTGLDLTTNVCMRTKADVLSSNATMLKIRGWATGNSTPTITIAIMKLTLADNSNAGIPPVLMDEFSITAAGNDTPRSFSRVTADFTESEFLAGDIIFPMIKSDTASTTIYFNLVIEIRSF